LCLLKEEKRPETALVARFLAAGERGTFPLKKAGHDGFGVS
jgi:hypothetical protein